VLQDDLQQFQETELAASNAKELPSGVVTAQKPVLQNLPSECKWLVVQQVYRLSNKVPELLQTDSKN
jgi:hypothetical protein